MRQPKEHVADDGTVTHKVRFRQGGAETSKTFRRRADALSFSAVLDGGGVVAALEWLAARERADSALTFGQWFETYLLGLSGVTARTRADYAALHRRYLAELDPMPLPLIGRTHVARIVNRLDDEGKSAKTIKNVIHMLSSCLALAVEDGHMAKNPCRRVRLPKPSLDVVDARFLEPAEFAALLAEIPEHYQPLVTFLVGTGLRWSEATALQARHVSLERGTVRVEQAWKWQGRGGGWKIGPPKSPKSRRTVNAATLALAAVEPLLGKPSAHVFTTPTGRVVRHNNFYSRIWIPATERSGIEPRPRVHDLRHTHASWLISDGQSLEAVQDQLGHESILTTRKVYGHLQPAIGVAVGKAASEALARALVQPPQLDAGATPAVPVAVAIGQTVGEPDQAADPLDVLPDGVDGRDR